MNKERVEEIALLVRNNGIKLYNGQSLGFNISTWATVRDCGTTTCIAGTCYIASDQFNEDFTERCIEKFTNGVRVTSLSKRFAFLDVISDFAYDYAKKYMGLTQSQATSLFVPSNFCIRRKWNQKELDDIKYTSRDLENIKGKMSTLTIDHADINEEMAYICMMNLIKGNRVNWRKAINHYFDELK